LNRLITAGKLKKNNIFKNKTHSQRKKAT
jgi:hypothetical protein